jgi:hypothetical protein
MGNFEVSVALFVESFYFVSKLGMIFWDCSKINNKSDRYVLFFEETIIRKQFHSLVV